MILINKNGKFSVEVQRADWFPHLIKNNRNTVETNYRRSQLYIILISSNYSDLIIIANR